MSKEKQIEELLSDLKKAVHDKAVYPHNKEFAFVNLRVFDEILANFLRKVNNYAE